MTDIFFSYRAVDRERVRRVRDALVQQGFDVFWDQELPVAPTGTPRSDNTLRKRNVQSCSGRRRRSNRDTARHEATIARLERGKLVAVLLEPLTPDQIPMGLYMQQAVKFLEGWTGDVGDAEWRKLSRDVEAKLTPAWVQRQIDELDAELVAERTRRESAENWSRVLQAQISKEVQVQQDLRHERDVAVDEVVALRTDVSRLSRSEFEGIAAEHRALQARIASEMLLQKQLKEERDAAVRELEALKLRLREFPPLRGRQSYQNPSIVHCCLTLRRPGVGAIAS